MNAMPSRDSTLELRLTAASASTRPSSEIHSLVMQLFDQRQHRLHHYVLAFGLSHHDAEDVVQESFLSLFHHLERGRPRWNLDGWLFRVAHNLALKRRTSNRSTAAGADHEDLLAQHPDPSRNAEEQLCFQQTQQRLSSVFNVLPELDRQCLSLRAEGLKYREIARTLGISLGAVSASISRSLERMNRATAGGAK